MSNKFIVIEGLEGAGKTSALTKVADILRNRGISNIVFTREPGGTPLAEKLRKIIKYSIDGEPISDCAEILMLYAARAQLLERVIKPALDQHSWVISDRHDLSCQAYQGGGRGINKHMLQTLRNMVLNDFYPDLTLYLDVPPKLGLSRINVNKKSDRIESESLEFFERTRARYQLLAKLGKNIITIDASQPISIVNDIIYTQITKWLNIQVTK